ncbi:MAG: hypothetical protein NTW08_02855 [Gammaproteobacteria bacterium]|nr:hypothetical protein [Gammaproteobacteria bacterium]
MSKSQFFTPPPQLTRAGRDFQAKQADAAAVLALLMQSSGCKNIDVTVDQQNGCLGNYNSNAKTFAVTCRDNGVSLKVCRTVDSQANKNPSFGVTEQSVKQCLGNDVMGRFANETGALDPTNESLTACSGANYANNGFTSAFKTTPVSKAVCDAMKDAYTNEFVDCSESNPIFSAAAKHPELAALACLVVVFSPLFYCAYQKVKNGQACSTSTNEVLECATVCCDKPARRSSSPFL